MLRKLKICLLLFVFLVLFPMLALAKTGTVTAHALNMRASANTDSEVVKVLKEGNRVEIQSASGSWYKVTFGSKTGWVAKKYVRVGNDDADRKETQSSDGTCAPGDYGSVVRKVQERLKKLGYYVGSVDGEYGDGTKKAVRNFQKRNGLSADGKVGAKTLALLNSKEAKKASASDAVKIDSDSEKTNKYTEMPNWYRGGSDLIPHHATFTVKDIKTGTTFKVKRWSGVNHMDCEPLTASDTRKLKSIYGGWSWKRRAILVRYNGHVYAASMNGMPHGTSTISDNNFDGHFCIHFYKSKTHGTKKVDSMHQNMVKEASRHTW